MKEKKCCGIYDYDGVLVPGEELMDQYIEKVCKEATNKYGEELFNQQLRLISEKQHLELDRDIFSGEMDEIVEELAEIERKIKRHFELKDQVLEETEKKYQNIINYDEIYRIENVYPGVLEALWKIHERGIYQQMLNNTHVNVNREIKAKERLLREEFPPMEFVPIYFHIFPYRDHEGLINKDRKPSDKVIRMVKKVGYINPLISTYVDNSISVIKCAKKVGLRPYFVDKNQDPKDSIIQAANDTIDIVHDNKIKKLSLF